MNKYYPTYFITAASVVDGTLVLTVNGAPAMSEHVHFALRLAPRVSIPSGLAADTPVVLSIGGVNYSIKDKYAEDVVYSSIPKDRINDVYFSPRFVIVGGVGSEVSEGETSYYFVAWNLPIY